MSVSLSPPMFLQFFVPGTNAPAVGYQLFTQKKKQRQGFLHV
jgi:hypothetical protein